MPVLHLHRLIPIAAVIVLASCSDPVRPPTPPPEVPVRPVCPATPPAPVPVPSPVVSATRLPTPTAGARPVPTSAVATAPTPQDQGSSDVDVAITAALRAAIRERRELSPEAQALMVTTRDRVVTLRGAVADEPERDAVLSLAHSMPEVQRVDDQLEPVVR